MARLKSSGMPYLDFNRVDTSPFVTTSVAFRSGPMRLRICRAESGRPCHTRKYNAKRVYKIRCLRQVQANQYMLLLPPLTFHDTHYCSREYGWLAFGYRLHCLEFFQCDHRRSTLVRCSTHKIVQNGVPAGKTMGPRTSWRFAAPQRCSTSARAKGKAVPTVEY